MLNFFDTRSLPLMDGALAPEALLGLAVVPAFEDDPEATVDVAVMRFIKWVRADNAALFLWDECWIGTPETLDEHLDRPETEDALIIGHGLFDHAFPVLERLGADISRHVPRTIDVGFEIAAKVEQENPWISYHSALGPTAGANSEGGIGSTPPPAFDERFDEAEAPWRHALWQATVSCWLWTVMAAEREVKLPLRGKQVRFDDDDLPVLLGAQPRFDETIWGLRQMLVDERPAA